MAQQARKFGARIAELREQRHWKQRDLVDKMADLGDDALNTNQLSRYENGGAMPGEQRQEWFAEALATTVADLIEGPVAERKKKGATPEFATPVSDARMEARFDQLQDSST